METKQSCKILPEELVEKIIAMMPFPSIFKARVLSKSWLARFSPVSSQNDEVEKRAALAFQKQVRERSATWSTFFPVCHDEGFYRAYDQQCQRWRKLPMPSIFPDESVTPMEQLTGIEGTLFYGYDGGRIFLANILTGSLKDLPEYPPAYIEERELTLECHRYPTFPVLAMDASQENYKMIVLQRYSDWLWRNCWYAHIYESTLDGWSTKKLVEVVPLPYQIDPFGHPVYLNGVLYDTYGYNSGKSLVTHLLTFNLEKGTVEELDLSLTGGMREIVWSDDIIVYPVVCNGKLFIVVTEGDPEDMLYPGVVWHVLAVDLGSLQLLEVARVPPVTLKVRRTLCKTPLSGGDCLFFETADDQLVAYNAQKDQWSFLDLPVTVRSACIFGANSFHPGLNPFMEV
ncbi:unnamed protein product [Calypogeia fissa]